MKRALLSLAALLALALPATARAQGPNSCELKRQEGNWQSVGDPANRVISAQGPLLVRCAGGEELRADSAVIYQTLNEVHLFRQVDYQDATRALTSDQAIYNSQTGRLYATGNVVFTDKTRGTTLRGPELEYFKAMVGRPEPQAIATQRPHLTIVPKAEAGGGRRQPTEVDADRITSVGERYVTAEGNVVIVNEDVRSTAAEAFYDSDAERTELRRQAFVDHKDYDLSGDFIETTLKGGVIQKVLARTDAHLVSEKLDVRGPQLQLFFERELLQRMVSSNEPGKGAGRSIALAKGFRMEADSIEALSPEQKLRQVNAVGTARGESWDTLAAPRVAIADTARADTGIVRTVANRPATEPPAAVEEKDLLLADTIIGFFRADSAAADSAGGDSARGAPRVLGQPARPDSARAAGRDTATTELERLLAIGNARSVYRVRDDSVKAGLKKQAINYLEGNRIDLTFAKGEVDQARVNGLKRGVYLDPDAPGDTARADSAAARPGEPGVAAPRAPRPAPPSPPAPTTPTVGAPPVPTAPPRGGTKPTTGGRP